EASLLLLVTDFEPELDQDDAAADDVLFDLRAELEKTPIVVLAAETHDVLDASAIVPTAVEDDDLTGGGEVRQIALQVDLTLLAIGRRGQRHGAKHPRAHPLGDRFDHAPFAGGVAS